MGHQRLSDPLNTLSALLFRADLDGSSANRPLRAIRRHRREGDPPSGVSGCRLAELLGNHWSDASRPVVQTSVIMNWTTQMRSGWSGRGSSRMEPAPPKMELGLSSLIGKNGENAQSDAAHRRLPRGPPVDGEAVSARA
jgi:hypothetical protein